MANAVYNTTVPYRNNLPGGSAAAVTIDAMTDDLHHFEFMMKWTGADGAVSFAVNTPAVALSAISLASPAFGPSGGVGSPGPATSGYPLYVEWVAGTKTGTIKENFYSGASLVASRDNIDPGYGAIYQGGATADAGRPGPQYAFVLNAGRFEAYINFRAGTGQIPIVSVPPLGALPGLVNPLRLEMQVDTNVAIRNIQFNGVKNLFKASFRAEDQIKYLGSQPAHFHLRMYQKGVQMNGIPLDIDTP